MEDGVNLRKQLANFEAEAEQILISIGKLDIARINLCDSRDNYIYIPSDYTPKNYTGRWQDSLMERPPK